jgi:transcriptional regulator with XRE-family HTH domain
LYDEEPRWYYRGSMNLGGVIKQLREQAGLKQEDFAALLHVSQQAVQQWEADETAPKGKRLLDVVRVLEKRGVSAAQQVFQAAAERAKGRALAKLPPIAIAEPHALRFPADSIAGLVSALEHADDATRTVVRAALGLPTGLRPDADRLLVSLIDAARAASSAHKQKS